MNRRIRVGFALTTLLGAGWAVAGLFAPTPTQFGIGVAVAGLGVVGYDVAANLW